MIFPDIFNSTDVKGFFTTREEGIDKDKIALVSQKSAKKIYLPIQKHTDHVTLLTESMTPLVADAVITKRDDVVIGVQSADCVPILVYERLNSIIAAVHAGWRGTAQGILKKVLNILKNDFSGKAEDVFVAIGPSIMECCYNVGAEVVESIKEATGAGEYTSIVDGRWHVNLVNSNALQAMSCGVEKKNIWRADRCTSCQPDQFFSFRKTGTKQRQGAFITLV